MANEGYVPKLDGSTLCHAGEGQRPLLRKEQRITITQNLYSMFPLGVFFSFFSYKSS